MEHVAPNVNVDDEVAKLERTDDWRSFGMYAMVQMIKEAFRKKKKVKRF
jgi:hypothetical protein